MDLRTQTYLQKLVRTTHGVALPEVLENKMVQDLQIQLERRLNEAVLKELANDEALQYTNMLQTNKSNAEVMEFLESRIPQMQELTKKVLDALEQEYTAAIHHKA